MSITQSPRTLADRPWLHTSQRLIYQCCWFTLITRDIRGQFKGRLLNELCLWEVLMAADSTSAAGVDWVPSDSWGKKKKKISVLSVLRLAVFVSLSRNHWDWKRLKQHFFIIICSIFPNVINLRLHTIILEATRITDLYSGPNPCRLFADELTKSKRRVHICPLQLWLFFSPPPWPQTFLCLSVHFQIRIKTDFYF